MDDMDIPSSRKRKRSKKKKKTDGETSREIEMVEKAASPNEQKHVALASSTSKRTSPRKSSGNQQQQCKNEVDPKSFTDKSLQELVTKLVKKQCTDNNNLSKNDEASASTIESPLSSSTKRRKRRNKSKLNSQVSPKEIDKGGINRQRQSEGNVNVQVPHVECTASHSVQQTGQQNSCSYTIPHTKIANGRQIQRSQGNVSGSNINMHSVSQTGSLPHSAFIDRHQIRSLLQTQFSNSIDFQAPFMRHSLPFPYSSQNRLQQSQLLLYGAYNLLQNQRPLPQLPYAQTISGLSRVQQIFVEPSSRKSSSAMGFVQNLPSMSSSENPTTVYVSAQTPSHRQKCENGQRLSGGVHSDARFQPSTSEITKVSRVSKQVNAFSQGQSNTSMSCGIPRAPSAAAVVHQEPLQFSLPVGKAPPPSDVEMMGSSDLPKLQDVQNLFSNNSMQVDVTSSICSENFFVVLDTNVLISNLSFIKDLIHMPSIYNRGPPLVYLPWVVLQELDGLKKSNSPKTKVNAIKAIHFLFTMSAAKSPRLKSETRKLHLQTNKEILKSDTMDDKIVSCCEALLKTCPKENLIILTNDKNLFNKAVAAEIEAKTVDILQKEIGYVPKNRLNVTAPVVPDEQKTATMVEELPGSLEVIKEIYVLKGIQEKGVKPVSFEPNRNTLIGEIAFFMAEILKRYVDTSNVPVSDTRFDVENPKTLTQILIHFKMHWSSVYASLFHCSLKDCFSALLDALQNSAGQEDSAKQAMHLLTVIEHICDKLSPKDMADCTSALTQLRASYNWCEHILSQSSVVVSTENEDNVVFDIFDTVWKCINNLCGTLLDMKNIPHELTYSKPNVLPSSAEVNELLVEFVPKIYELKQRLSKALHSNNEAMDNEMRLLYTSLSQFMIRLKKLGVAPPPSEANFTIARLKAFFINSENGKMLQNGLLQIEKYFSLLRNSIA